MSAAAATGTGNLAYEVSNISILEPKVKELDQLANQSLQKVKAQGIAISVKMGSIEDRLKRYSCALPSTWTSLKHTVDTPEFNEVDREDLIAAVKEVKSTVSHLQKKAAEDKAASRVARGLPAEREHQAHRQKSGQYAHLTREEIHKRLGKFDELDEKDKCVIL